MTLAARKDHYIVSAVGIVFGLLLIPVLENIKPPFWMLTARNAAGLVIGFFLFANTALAVGGWIGFRVRWVWQFVKYAAVGSTNALLDFGILNFLSLIFKIYSGIWLAVFNVISIIIAMTNSYLLNRFWSFLAEGVSRRPLVEIGEFSRFIAINIVTIVINTSFVYVLTTIVGAPENISEPLWENISKIIAVPISISVNFLGFKFFVFKS